ncbi:hypothetical protein DSM3645_06921 [Blastopirellula marina DSM 3645]|uniref:Uncharacterized protein n=1 Tax=Blastopirellula marina DSM 3645 TaxID=314230 RepID=A3ZYF3_9BACT|nr:hypothetical protein DSM3645_06921 [Blastopirellula marina DSM 3645]
MVEVNSPHEKFSFFVAEARFLKLRYFPGWPR